MVPEKARRRNSRIRPGMDPPQPSAGCGSPYPDVIQSRSMRVSIYSNGIEAPLTSFIGRFLGNVCAGIAASLKTPLPIRSLEYELDGEELGVWVNQAPLDMNMSRGFSKVIVRDTIRGMIRHLKLADPEGSIRIEIDMEKES